MTLKEIQGESQRVYQDNERLSQTKWAEILGIRSTTFKGAVRTSGADVLKDDHRHDVTVPVRDFPVIVAEFGGRKKGRYYEPWAKGVDTKKDFQVTPPSDAVLIYEYPSLKDKLTDFVRSLRR